MKFPGNWSRNMSNDEHFLNFPVRKLENFYQEKGVLCLGFRDGYLYVGYFNTKQLSEFENEADFSEWFSKTKMDTSISVFKLDNGEIQDAANPFASVLVTNKIFSDITSIYCTRKYLFVQAMPEFTYAHGVVAEKLGYIVKVDENDLSASKCIKEISSQDYFIMHSFDDKLFYRDGNKITRFDEDPSKEQSIELEELSKDKTIGSMTDYNGDLYLGIDRFGILIIDSDSLTVKDTIKVPFYNNIMISNNIIYGSDHNKIYRSHVESISDYESVYTKSVVYSIQLFKGLLYVQLHWGPGRVKVYSPSLALLHSFDIECDQLCLTPEHMLCLSYDKKTLQILDHELNNDK